MKKIILFIITSFILTVNVLAYSSEDFADDYNNAVKSRKIENVIEVLKKAIWEGVITVEERNTRYAFARKVIFENSIQKRQEQKEIENAAVEAQKMEKIRNLLETSAEFRAAYNWPLPEWFSHPDIDYRIKNGSYTYNAEEENQSKTNSILDEMKKKNSYYKNASMEEIFWEWTEEIVKWTEEIVELIEEAVELKDQNKYVKYLSEKELNKFYIMREKIEIIVQKKLAIKLNKLAKFEKSKTINALNEKIRVLDMRAKDYYKKSVLEEIRLQIEQL